MKVKITDFIMEMGKICDENIFDCHNCPFWHGGYFHYEGGAISGCLRDGMQHKEIAEVVKRKVLERMKGDSNKQND